MHGFPGGVTHLAVSTDGRKVAAAFRGVPADLGEGARVSADGRMPAAAYGGGAARLWYLPGRDAYGTAQLPITPLRPGTEPTESPPQ